MAVVGIGAIVPKDKVLAFLNYIGGKGIIGVMGNVGFILQFAVYVKAAILDSNRVTGKPNNALNKGFGAVRIMANYHIKPLGVAQ